jgi:hypothetical protein
LAQRRAEVVQDIGRAVERGRPSDLDQLLERAFYLDDVGRALAVVLPPSLETSGPLHDSEASPAVSLYMMGSLFAAEAFDFLMSTSRRQDGQQEAESMALVSGVRVGGVRGWDRLVKTPISFRSKVGAAIDGPALSMALRMLDKHGHALYGVIHLHLHHGAPSPSSTDLALQKKFEDGGYPVVQAVFSESGHFRFFSHDREFEVMTYGTGIERLDHRLYRISAPTADAAR